MNPGHPRLETFLAAARRARQNVADHVEMTALLHSKNINASRDRESVS
jgi:hypothetical protein